MHSFTLIQTVVVALLIVANAFFVAAEFALVSVRETRVEQLLAQGRSGARAVQRLQGDLDTFLPAVQLGITFCSLVLGWIAEPLVAGWIENLFALLGLPHAAGWSHLLAVVLGFGAITYITVVVGEQAPKMLAINRAEVVALAVAPPMLLFMAVARPAVRFLKDSTAVILRGFQLPVTERASVHSAEELKLIATAARRMGLMPAYQETIVHRAVEIQDVPVREIMTPRQQIFSLPSSLRIDEAAGRVIDRKFSRIPVYDDSRGPEHIVGVVYAKDLARLMHFQPRGTRQPGAAPFVQLTLQQMMRDVLVVPETKTALDLLREFQQRRRHMAIVVDEYGSTVGLVTAEDAIEQLTGELDDEFDDPSRPMLTMSSGTMLLDGSVNLRDLETQMQWSLPREGGVETLAGFLLVQLGFVPRGGEVVEFEGRRMTVLAMEGRRIARVRVEAVDSAVETAIESKS